MMPETLRTPGENSERDQSDRGRLHAVADQTAEVARQVGDKGADLAKRAVQTATDAGRRTAEAATHLGEKVSGAVKGTTETATDAAQRTAEIARNTAERGREAALSGFRAIAGAQAPLADAGFEQSRRALEVTSAVTDVYRQAAERAAGDVRALFDCWANLGRGMQQWQQAYVDAVRGSMESLTRKRQDLVQANSPVQFAEVQRDLYVDFVNHTAKASATLLQLAGQIAQDAVRPLQERAHART
jgi:hypothetical protein